MSRNLLTGMAHGVYRIPYIGLGFRRVIEFFLGERLYQNAAYWNESLTGWASSYLGGTLAIDLRNLITLLLAKQLVPTATSILDLGCAGGTLALCLGPEYQTYWGVDISDVAIEKAKDNENTEENNRITDYHLVVAAVQDFQPSRTFDVIVFNEVLYYLPLNLVAATLTRYSSFLSPGGVIIVSLKDEETSRLVQAIVSRELKLEYGVLYQQQPECPRWKVIRNRETPAHLVQALRAVK